MNENLPAIKVNAKVFAQIKKKFGTTEGFEIERRVANPARLHPLYGIWKAMRRRCNSPKTNRYEYYGARGIRVCAEWDDFWVFVRDVGPRPSSAHSLDRKNNDGPYAPWNCKWSTAKEQILNSRTAVFLEYSGERKCVADWARTLGVDEFSFRYQIRKGGADAAFAWAVQNAAA